MEKRIPRARMVGRGIGAAGVACALLAAAPAGAQEEASALGPEVSVRPGKGVAIEQPGAFELRARGRMQILEALEDAPDAPVESETIVRRARITLDGYAFSEDLTWKLQLGFGPRDLDPDGAPVLDAWVNWAAARDLELRVGLDKVPFDRQQLTSSGDLQFVDRARVVGAFSIDRDVGISLRSDDLFGLDGRLGYALGVYGGEGRGRLAAPAGFLSVARLEVRPFGAFEDLREGDLERTPRPRLAIGASIAWNEDAIRSRGNRSDPIPEARDLASFEGFDYLHLEADVVFEWSGLSLLAELLWQRARGDAPGAVGAEGPVEVLPHQGWGFFVQAGQMIGPHFEVAARYGQQETFAGTNPAQVEEVADAGRELGVGASWYVHGHAVKVQVDGFRSWGVRQRGAPTRGFDDAIQALRAQVQLAF